jgi:uncharacterized protein
VKIEYDYAKDQTNLAKHGLSLAVGEFVISDPACVTVHDDRQDYGEDRYVAYGSVVGRVLVAVYTMRGDTYRFISVRKANAEEQTLYVAG